MNEISVNYGPLSDKAVLALASKVHLAATTEPCIGYFESLEPLLTKLKLRLELLRGALDKETSTSITALRKSTRDDVVETLTELAAQAELEVKGDLMKLAATGFELKKKGSRTGAPTETPVNFRVTVTGISGEGLGRCKAVKGARSYEGQYALSANGPWTDIDPSTSSQRLLFTGLERGKDYFFRARAFGPNGYSGWSDIATMMVV